MSVLLIGGGISKENKYAKEVFNNPTSSFIMLECFKGEGKTREFSRLDVSPVHIS